MHLRWVIALAALLFLAFIASRISAAGTNADRAIGRDAEAGKTPNMDAE